MKISVSHVLFSLHLAIAGKIYEPTWESLDSRPLPKWYDDAKIGIFLHWGVYSVPAFHEWFWYYWANKNPTIVKYMEKYYPPDFTYADFASEFRADLYDPDELADIFQSSGAKYVVLTSKHHEGYAMWPSKYSFGWNAAEVGPKRDLVGLLASSVRGRTDLRMGLYHSLYEWFNPLYLDDQRSGFKTKQFSLGKTVPELFEVVDRYRPDVIWSDGDRYAPDVYWNSTEFLAWLYNYSPVRDTVVVNDRWGTGTICNHGGFYTCHDHFNPGVLQKHKWENCMTLDFSSWGYRRAATYKDIIKIERLLYEVTSTVSCGGNILINAGIRSDGKIDAIMEERFRQLGSWLKVNGEAIYASEPWTFQNDTITSRIWYTSKKTEAGTVVYAAVHDWPADNVLTLGAPLPSKGTTVSMLGHPTNFEWVASGAGRGIEVLFPFIPPNKLPSPWVWVLKLTNIQ